MRSTLSCYRNMSFLYKKRQCGYIVYIKVLIHCNSNFLREVPYCRQRIIRTSVAVGTRYRKCLVLPTFFPIIILLCICHVSGNCSHVTIVEILTSLVVLNSSYKNIQIKSEKSQYTKRGEEQWVET
jgi:hypothetical protein